ncbi:MAG: hypothetical protein AAF206_27820 [Bacteroidota bacterium]
MSSICLLIGKQRTGKSTTFAKIAREVSGKCLILDPGENKAFQEFPVMPATNAWKFNNPNRQGKIWRIEDSGKQMDQIEAVFGFDQEGNYNKRRAYLNGNLFLEDAGAYIDSNLKRGVINTIKKIKQHGLNLFLSYHTISEISPQLIKMGPRVLILKKTKDKDVFSHISKAKELGSYQKVMQAYYRVKFYGMTEQEIADEMDLEYLFGIARDLRFDLRKMGIKNVRNPSNADIKKVSKAIFTFSHGQKTMKGINRELAKYHAETIVLEK